MVVTFRLDPAAGQRFGKLTRENVGRQMAILLDREVITAPRIDSEIPSGMGIITGQFTVQEADDLARSSCAPELCAPGWTSWRSAT